MQRRRWILTAEPNGSLDSIRETLVRRGCTIETMFKEIGSMVVSSDSVSKEELAAIKGVQSVEPDSDIDIGRPGDADTW